MRKTIIGFAAVVLAVGLTSAAAMAGASGSIGCGGGNGASVPCNGDSLGIVTQSGSTFSGSVDAALTSVSGIPSSVSGLNVFTPNTDQFDFSFSGVGPSSGGTFTFSDMTEPGVLTVTGTAIWTGTPPSGLVGTLDLSLDALHYAFSYMGFSASGSLNASGTVALTLDPGNVTTMAGSVGLPSTFTSGSGPSATPEPGTLLLLSTGLPVLGFLRRKFARA
jgi:hypothetical protein